MRRIKLLLLLTLPLLLCACGGNGGTAAEPVTEAEPAEEVSRPAAMIPAEKLEGNPLYVRQVENLPDDFILGMDASSVLAEEACGVVYRGFDGAERDVFETLAGAGITHIRVRVWNDPFDADGHGYGGGSCDIDAAVELGCRVTQCGMKLIVDFHYSDFWADPSKQMVPKAWEGMEIEEKTEAVYEYTKDCLTKLRDAGVAVGMVQLGNETNGRLCGEKTWFNIQYLMQAGSRAVREVYPEALVAVHFANPESEGSYAAYASKLAYYDVDYDVFASSYYPFWHGTLDNLAAVLTDIAETYGKKVMVMETSYAYTPEDTDFFPNTISDDSAVTKSYPYTVQGQANSVRDVIDTIANRTANGIGVVYWEGTWITVGGDSHEENAALWETYGSGWATSFAAAYDPDDAGRYYGGCAVDNQAMFAPDGTPLPSLQIFNLVRFGNEPAIVADAIEDTALSFDLGSAVVLPDTVNAVMSDGSTRPVPVVWDVTEDELAAMRDGGVNVYALSGTADGLPARCVVSMEAFNYLTNPGFESGDLTGWQLNELGSADELYVEDKVTDSLGGTWHMHFWSAAENSVAFTLEQPVTGLPAGTYRYSISIMGGDAGETDVYAYVKLDGKIAATAPMQITAYGSWDTGVIDDIAYDGTQEIAVGISVQCQGSGAGAWGKIDDASLSSAR